MPIYEYVCENCGHHLEKLQRVSEAPLQQCPKCHQDTLKRLISAAGFRLKGGGWYETDFKDSDKKRNLAETSEATKAETQSSETGASEAISETKTDTTSKESKADDKKGGKGSDSSS